jgi:urease accessory protein
VPAELPAPELPASRAVSATGPRGTAARCTAALLALADQRLPSGGHVHSGGIEQAVADGVVHDVATLSAFLDRRVRTAGLVAAGIAAAATTASRRTVAVLDAETDARTPSPAQREASRAQGRGLLRTARAAWPAPATDLSWTDLGARPHHPVVLGCAARAAGIDADGAALVAAYLAVTGPATAAQRLLALDPVSVATVTILLGDAIESVAAQAAQAATRCAPSAPQGWRDLPDDGDPFLDLLSERHAPRGDKLFAS